MRAGFRQEPLVPVAQAPFDQRPGPPKVMVPAGVGVFPQARGTKGSSDRSDRPPLPQTYKPIGLGRVESAISRTRPSESRQALAQAETAAGAGAKSRPEKPMDRS